MSKKISIPNTMRVGPFVPTVLVKKKYVLLYIFIIWLSTIPVLLEFWIYWQFLWSYVRPVHFYIYLPLLCFGMYVTIVFSALIISKFILIIVNTIHKPREGVFLRDSSDIDYRYWSLRNTIKRWPIWLAHKFPFPFLDNICFKMFGVKTKFTNSLFEGWVDCEFIEFGENVVVGQGSTVQSAVIIGNLLIVKKTIIEDNVRIGAHAIIMPGTHIGKNCILNTWSLTTVGQELEEGWIYNGVPAKKYKENVFFRDGLEEKILGKIENMDELIEKYESQWERRHLSETNPEENGRLLKGKKRTS